MAGPRHLLQPATAHGLFSTDHLIPKRKLRCAQRQVVIFTLSHHPASTTSTRRAALCSALTLWPWSGILAPSAALALSETQAAASPVSAPPQFYEVDGSGGVKALDVRQGTGDVPRDGDKVSIHYYARLGTKQGWRFDATYDHKDAAGVPEPFEFVVGSGDVIAGLDAAVRSMREGGVRRVIIPPSQGYQNTTQGPVPPDFFDRRRLYSTVFNPTRLANGDRPTVIFDIQLLRIRSARESSDVP